MLVEEAGGCCVVCGYDARSAALQFHRLDPGSEAFKVAGQGGRVAGAVASGGEKCVLLCSNCHAEVEAGVVEVAELNRPRGRAAVVAN